MANVIALIFFCFLLFCQGYHAESSYPFKYDLPQTRSNVSESCAAQLDVFVTALTNFDLWALTMLDASSKIPTGILEGNIYDMGNYDQCVGIEHKTENLTIKGKHCLQALLIPLSFTETQHSLRFLPFKIPRNNRDDTDPVAGINLALCIPDSCKPTEVSAYLNIESALFKDDHCKIYEETSLNAWDVVVVTFLSIILFFMAWSTIYDVYRHKIGQPPSYQILVAFSVFTNGRKLLAVSTDDKRQLTSLHGLRCISIIWIVAGHRYALNAAMPSVNALAIVEWTTQLYSQYIQAAFLAVDTFFFLSGMMISYSYFSKKVKPKIVSFLPLFYLHRYLRLTPAAAALFLVVITVWQYFGSGPIWMELAEAPRDACLKWWWSFFLYIQNYVNNEEACLLTTWYLSVDMQLYILSPLIFLPLEYIMVRSSKRIVYATCASLIVIFMIIQAVVRLHFESMNEHMAHERLAVWMVGFTAGILIQEAKTKKLKLHINRFVNLFIWAVVLVGMASIVLTMHDVRQNPKELNTNMFDTFHRPAWGLGLAWIVYSCTIGYGGFVNWFLSLPVFQVLSRLTYCMYLIHIFVIFFSLGHLRTQNYFSDFNAFYLFCGDLICTTLIALLWVLAFESPMITIEKYLFGPCMGTNKGKQKLPVKENVDLNANASKSIPNV